MDSGHHAGSPFGVLIAAGAVTAVSLIPALTMYMQFTTAFLGLVLALYGTYRTFFKKPTKKDSDNE